MKGKSLNDLWSAYRYGDQIKVVYHKVGKVSERKPLPVGFVPSEPTEDEIEGRFEQSISRTRSTIFELAMCNDFTHFCTFTIDPEKRDSYDLRGLHKALAQFIRDQNRTRSLVNRIRYLIIPEQHQSGAWHFHGLIAGLTKADLTINGNGYLDWSAYRKRFGFFSCEKIKSHEACSKYVTKYITKDVATDIKREAGAHLYYASQGLKRREPLVTLSADPCPFYKNDRSEEWDFENDYVKIRWVKIADDGDLKF